MILYSVVEIELMNITHPFGKLIIDCGFFGPSEEYIIIIKLLYKYYDYTSYSYSGRKSATYPIGSSQTNVSARIKGPAGCNFSIFPQLYKI